MDYAPIPVSVPVPPQQPPIQRLLELLIKEIYKGNRRESTFKAESWELICHQLNIEYLGHALPCCVPDLKTHVHHQKMQYHFFSSLLALDGVQWDMRTNEVKAEDSVWKAYYKAFPYAPCYHHGGPKFYDLLKRIFESGVVF